MCRLVVMCCFVIRYIVVYLALKLVESGKNGLEAVIRAV